jgi:O-antigen/teichoic acid export membrane protein
MDQVARERARSLKFVQVVFAVLGLLSLFAALLVVLRGEELGLPEASTQTIAIAFLAVGAVDTALLFVWERIFQRMQPLDD